MVRKNVLQAAVAASVALFLSAGCIQPFGFSPEALQATAQEELPQVEAPLFAIAPGVYNRDLSLSLSTPTAEATIHVTTDGTTPTESSPVYTGPIPITGHETTVTIQAIAAKEDMRPSDVASATYTINYNAVNPPTFSVLPGTYNTDQFVSIVSDEPVATIFYTTDGTDPDPADPSQIYGGPIPVVGHDTIVTINAIAVAPQALPSTVASATYTINYNAVNPPTFSVLPGTYNTDQSVSIESDEPAATIFYTTDGTDPDPADPSQIYGGPIPVVGHDTIVTINAIAVAPQTLPSTVASATYTINYDAANAPSFSLAPGTYDTDQSVTITNNDPDATIYYTTDGSDPDTNDPSQIYGGETISVAGHNTTVTIIATATAPQKQPATVTGTYSIVWNTVATPIFQTSAAPTYDNAISVSISMSTAGATIHYTTDGSPPTASSTQYGGPIAVDGTTTIRAIGVRSGYVDSAGATATYNFKTAPVSINTSGGTFNNAVAGVELSTNTSGATIHYTTDGSTPTPSSTQYGGPLTITSTQTLRAIAVKTDYADSNVASETYTLVVADVFFSITGGTFDNDINTITLWTETNDATIYYTTDGSFPNPATSDVYSAPLSVTSSQTISTIAVKNGYTDSNEVFNEYTMEVAPVTFTPNGGTYNNDLAAVTLSTNTTDATIHYTTDNTTPTTGSPIYGAPLSVTSDQTIRAIAVKNGYAGTGVFTASYAFQVAEVDFSVAPGSYTQSFNVALTTTTTGAAVHYTLDGSEPTASSPTYSGSIPIQETTTLRARAFRNGYTAGPISTAAYTLDTPYHNTTFADVQQAQDAGQLNTTPTDNSGANRLPLGTVFYISTDQGRLVKLVLREDKGDGYWYDLIAYNNDGSVFQHRVRNFINPNNSVDADFGFTYEGTGTGEFALTAADGTPPTSFIPINGATMLVIRP